MRALLGCVLALGLAVSPALARTNNSDPNPTSSDSSSSTSSNSTAAPAGAADPSTESSSTVALATPASSAKPAPAAADPQANTGDAPLQLKIGSAYLTPIGFMDFTGVGRTTNAGNGIGSNFGSIPYPFTSAGAPGTAAGINLSDHATEARFSMQNSRIGFRFDAAVMGAHVIGYMEADFLGTSGSNNIAVTNNANVLRSRLYWVDVSKGQWEFLAGQTWGLFTPNRTGISPIPGNIFITNDIDVNYNLGLVWARLPEFRFVWHPSNKAALAVALDQNEQYAGGVNGAGTIILPSGAGVSGGVTGLTGAAGTNQQLNAGNTTFNSPQVFPDITVKAAFDPSAKLHVEAGGIERQFRVVVNSPGAGNPEPTFTPVVNRTATGGAAFLNLNVQLFPGFRLLTNNFFGTGAGRYIFGQAPDLIVGPDGGLTTLMSGSDLSGFEYTHKNTLIYSYYGVVYIDRDLQVNANTEYGYGLDSVVALPLTPVTSAANQYTVAIGQNRTVQEPTIGFNQTLWRDAKYGALNFMGQVSYIQRSPWSTSAGQPKHADLTIAFINLRYTLPGGAPSNAQLGLK